MFLSIDSGSKFEIGYISYWILRGYVEYFFRNEDISKFGVNNVGFVVWLLMLKLYSFRIKKCKFFFLWGLVNYVYVDKCVCR